MSSSLLACRVIAVLILLFLFQTETTAGPDVPKRPVVVSQVLNDNNSAGTNIAVPANVMAYFVRPGVADGNRSRCLYKPALLKFAVNGIVTEGVLVSAISAVAGRAKAIKLFLLSNSKAPEWVCMPEHYIDDQGNQAQILSLDMTSTDDKIMPQRSPIIDIFEPDSAGYVNFALSSVPSGVSVSVDGELKGGTTYEFSAPLTYLRKVTVKFKAGKMTADKCKRIQGRYRTTIYLQCAEPTTN